MANVDSPLKQKIRHVSKRKQEPNAHHHCQADDVGAGVEVAEGTKFLS